MLIATETFFSQDFLTASRAGRRMHQTVAR